MYRPISRVLARKNLMVSPRQRLLALASSLEEEELEEAPA